MDACLFRSQNVVILVFITFTFVNEFVDFKLIRPPSSLTTVFYQSTKQSIRMIEDVVFQQEICNWF